MQAPPPLSAASISRGTMFEVLATTTLIQIIGTATMLCLTPIASVAALSFGVDAHMVGYQISLIYCFCALGSAFTGALVGRHGPVRIEQLALILFAVGLLGLATSNFWLAALASALIGLGYGMVNPTSSLILNRVAPPHHRNMIFSIKQAGVPIGGVVAALSFPLLDRIFGWQASFAVVALLPITLGLYLNHQVEGSRRPQFTQGKNWLESLLDDQSLIWLGPLRPLIMMSLLYSAVQMILTTFIVLMLIEDRGWSLMAAAGTAGLVQLSGAFGRIFWGVASDRTGRGMAMLAVIGGICTVGMIGLYQIETMPEWLLILILCMLGATASGWNGVAMAEMVRMFNAEEASRVVGAILVYTFIGVVLGPASFAALYGVIGSYGACFALFGAASGLGCLVALLASLREPRL